MILSGGVLGELIAGIPRLMYLTGKEVFKKKISLVKDTTPTWAKKATENYLNKGINMNLVKNLHQIKVQQ